MAIRRTSSDPVKVTFRAKKAVSLPVGDIGKTTSPGQVKGVQYANGDGYVGELKNGRRHGEGVYAFGTHVKVQVTRHDKAVFDESTEHHSKGQTVRTSFGGHSGQRVYSGTSPHSGIHSYRPSREHRPDEEFQGGKVSGTWKNDELIKGEIRVLNRAGSVKKFTVSGDDLNLISSPIEGQALTMKTYEGADGKAVRLPGPKRQDK